jgi:Pentapeptide repeats (8 copies)
MTDSRPFLDVILGHAGHPGLPDGYDTWGFKIVRPDLRSYGGFRWPWPGGTVDDPDAIASDDPCPTDGTGGYCVALSLAGAASGGHGHTTILLLAYREADVLARSGDKLRARSAHVADVIDGQAVYRSAQHADLRGAYLEGADLRGAYLQGAYLRGAYLRGAYLQGAYLEHAYLQDANLQGAYLQDAYLRGADLRGAYLQDADLRGADLQGAYLEHAYLQDADLRGADLQGAYLQDADLRGADLQHADLQGANLQCANLQGANLQHADLRGADLEGAYLQDAIGVNQ